MNVNGLPVPQLAAAETERESATETILSDTKTAMTRAAASLVPHADQLDNQTQPAGHWSPSCDPPTDERLSHPWGPLLSRGRSDLTR